MTSAARCAVSVAQIDVFPTLIEISGAKRNDQINAQVRGRSLVPLLKKPESTWENRELFTHVGRWPNGSDPNLHKYETCAVRDQRYSLVNNRELYDLQNDLAQKYNIIQEHPEIAQRLRKSYDAWWNLLDKSFVNESAYRTAPKINAFRELYEKQ